MSLRLERTWAGETPQKALVRKIREELEMWRERYHGFLCNRFVF